MAMFLGRIFQENGDNFVQRQEVGKSGEDGKDGENTVSVSKSYSEFSQGEKLAWRKRKLQVTDKTLTRVL